MYVKYSYKRVAQNDCIITKWLKIFSSYRHHTTKQVFLRHFNAIFQQKKPISKKKIGAAHLRDLTLSKCINHNYDGYWLNCSWLNCKPKHFFFRLKYEGFFFVLLFYPKLIRTLGLSCLLFVAHSTECVIIFCNKFYLIWNNKVKWVKS
jgi:hypothetical protein